MTKEHAADLALQAIHAANDGTKWALLHERTEERVFGWVFGYQSERFVETGAMGDQVPGCGPVLVDRISGTVEFLPTYRPAELLINEFEAAWKARHSS